MLIYRDLATTYDVIINFKEAHEKADELIQGLIKRNHISEILEESKKQVNGCNIVLSQFTDNFNGFSEICKVI